MPGRILIAFVAKLRLFGFWACKACFAELLRILEKDGATGLGRSDGHRRTYLRSVGGGAWFGLLLPETGRHKEKYQKEKRWVLGMEFRTFLNPFMKLPCQIVRSGRRLVFRLLSWNLFQPILFRLVDSLRR